MMWKHYFSDPQLPLCIAVVFEVKLAFLKSKYLHLSLKTQAFAKAPDSASWK